MCMRKAYLINNGIFNTWANGYEGRILLVFLVALSQKIFGINYFSGSFVSLIGYFISTIYIFKVGKYLYSEKIGFWASLFFTSLPLSVSLSTEALPDMFWCGMFTISFYYFVRFDKEENNIFLFIIGLISGAAFFVREFVVLWIFVVFLYLMFFKKKWRYLFYYLIGILLPLLLGHFVYYLLYGDFFYRFTRYYKSYENSNQVLKLDNLTSKGGMGQNSQGYSLFYYSYSIFTKIGSVGILSFSCLVLYFINIKKNFKKTKVISITLLVFFILLEFILRFIISVPRVMNYSSFLFPLIALLCTVSIDNISIENQKLQKILINIFRFLIIFLILLFMLFHEKMNDILSNQWGSYNMIYSWIIIFKIAVVVTFLILFALTFFKKINYKTLFTISIILVNLLIFNLFHYFWSLSRKEDMAEIYSDYTKNFIFERNNCFYNAHFEGLRQEFLSDYKTKALWNDPGYGVEDSTIYKWNNSAANMFLWVGKQYKDNDLLIIGNDSLKEMKVKEYRNYYIIKFNNSQNE